MPHPISLTGQAKAAVTGGPLYLYVVRRPQASRAPHLDVDGIKDASRLIQQLVNLAAAAKK
ncbi:hypothetical protein AB0I51_28520 [Streptomyces sp. NPDC050549]|uniref:hypothetical protein n=1 Tax=Streptomyces sp. NPDC050549 TaxID=3155406 RepID=UPI003448C7E6